MSAPALRQPKVVANITKTIKKLQPSSNQQNVILTLKGDRKLVISSDSYHGILMVGNMYKCVFCGSEMELDDKIKEAHVNSQKHKKCMEMYPHLEEFSENLLRKLTPESLYCTICNVVVSMQFTTRHIVTEVHKQELDKAKMRATIYQPCLQEITTSNP